MKFNKSFLSILVTATFFSLNVSAFSLIPERNLINGELQVVIAKLLVNDRPFECLVDTGARFTMVNAKFIKDLTVVGTTIGGGISNPNQVTELVAANLKISDSSSEAWVIENATIARTPRLPYECLIGNDFFINRSFSVDMTKLRIENATLDPNERFHSLKVYKNSTGGHFGFPIIMAEDEMETIYDTGASATVIDIAFIKKHPDQFQFIKGTNATDGNNQQIPVGFYKAKQLRFADAVFKNVEVYGLDLTALREKIPNVYGIIGMNIIKEYKWTFDVPNSAYNFK